MTKKLSTQLLNNIDIDAQLSLHVDDKGAY